MPAGTQASANKAVVRRLFEEFWNERQFDTVNELLVDDYAERETAWANAVLAAFPDTHFTIEDMVADGDRVWTHVTWRATHQGEFSGIPATGKPVEISAVFIHLLNDGKGVRSLGFGGTVSIPAQIQAAIAGETGNTKP